MDLYSVGATAFLEEFNRITKVNIDLVQFENIKEPLLELSERLKQMSEDFSVTFLSEDMKRFVEEVKESEKLSQSEFEEKYAHEIEICSRLGNAGWVISEHINSSIIKAWYKLLCDRREREIVRWFEEDNGWKLSNILKSFENKYEGSNQIYFEKAKCYFTIEDYMTSAMYLVALIEARVASFIKYPPRVSNSIKYSVEGFGEHLANEFTKNSSFFAKRFLFLQMYPSIIGFLNRLFVDREYLFEKGIEPPYVNRNWLMHGRSSRKIERFECIQLINALSTIEYVFSLSVRDNITGEGG